MLAGAKGGDMITKQSCGAVLSALSSKVGTLLIMGWKNRGVLPPRCTHTENDKYRCMSDVAFS